MFTDRPDLSISVRPARGRWRARFENHVIADSVDALIVHDGGAAPLIYFPRADVETDYMSATDKRSHSSVAGAATSYTILMDGHFAENGAFSYDAPPERLEPLAGRIAFNSDRIEVYEVDDQALNVEGHRDIDEAVRHTDSGSGRSQAAPWPPNVTRPD